MFPSLPPLPSLMFLGQVTCLQEDELYIGCTTYPRLLCHCPLHLDCHGDTPVRLWVAHWKRRRDDAVTSSEMPADRVSSSTYDVYEMGFRLKEIRASKPSVGWCSRKCMETPAFGQRAADALRELSLHPLETETKEEEAWANWNRTHADVRDVKVSDKTSSCPRQIVVLPLHDDSFPCSFSVEPTTELCVNCCYVECVVQPRVRRLLWSFVRTLQCECGGGLGQSRKSHEKGEDFGELRSCAMASRPLSSRCSPCHRDTHVPLTRCNTHFLEGKRVGCLVVMVERSQTGVSNKLEQDQPLAFLMCDAGHSEAMFRSNPSIGKTRSCEREIFVWLGSRVSRQWFVPLSVRSVRMCGFWGGATVVFLVVVVTRWRGGAPRVTRCVGCTWFLTWIVFCLFHNGDENSKRP